LKSLNIDGYNFWLTPMEDQGVILTPIDQKRNPAITAQQIQQQLQEKKCKYIDEVIATSEEIFIASSRSKKAIKELRAMRFKKTSITTWNVPVLFNECEDWKKISAETSITREDFITELLQLKIMVQMLGFLPGFVYAEGLTKKMQVPRKEIPVANRKANVLAVGGPYLGVYSIPSPSGWYIIGDIPLQILNLDDGIPIPFKIEDRLVLKSISKKDYEQIFNKKLNLVSYNA